MTLTKEQKDKAFSDLHTDAEGNAQLRIIQLLEQIEFNTRKV